MIELCYEYLSVRCIWLYVIIMSRTSFRVNLKSTVCLNVKEFLAWSRRHIWGLSDSKGTQNHNHLVDKWTQNHLATLVKWLTCVVKNDMYGTFDCILLSYHVRVSVNLHSTVCRNVKELLTWSRRHISSLSDCNGIKTRNHLVYK